MNDPSSVDAFGRHLATLLTTVDLSARVAPIAARTPASDLLVVARAAVGATRASLFRIHGFAGDGDERLGIVRLARADLAGGSDVSVDFQEHTAALLLSCLGSGASEAVGPVGESEPFRAVHVAVEPDPSPYAVFVPIAHEGEPLGVLEATRADRAFSAEETAVLEAAARVAVGAVFLAAREDTVAATLIAMLPADVRATSLRARVRRFLIARRSTADERRALVVAASISELARHSSRALVLADELLEAIHRGFGGAAREGLDDDRRGA